MSFEKLTEFLNHMVEEEKTPGVDCIVYQGHEMIYRYFTGKSDIEAGRNVKGDEIYLLFSMTKMLTCTAALQLYEQGKYRLQDPISKYLPEFAKMKLTDEELDTKEAARIAGGSSMGDYSRAFESGYAKTPITVEHLFTMSAGLDYNLQAEGIQRAKDEGRISTRDLAGALSETVLGFEPGTRFRYSLCHDVLGALIEVWSGESLGCYMKQHIFEPLGMKDTFFHIPTDAAQRARFSALYRYDSEGNPERLPLACPYELSGEYESGGAGLCSCTEDYALFLDALACGGVGKSGNRILRAETVERMRTDHLDGQRSADFEELRPGYGYGLGVRVHKEPEKSGALSPVGEFGWDGAAGCFSMVDVENKLSLTYFQQIHGWDVKIQCGLCNALYTDLK